MPELPKDAETFFEPGPQDRAPGPDCPMSLSLRVLGGKWKLLLIQYLLERPRRYGELRRLLAPISEKVLIRELRELEHYRLVSRSSQPTVPPRVDYALTEEGYRVEPVIKALLQWGSHHQAYLASSDANAGIT